MDKKVIDQIINLVGEQAAIKAVCNISDKGQINEALHAKKIERARWFGLLEKDSLTLTDLGKLFAAKLFLDLADTFDSNVNDEEDEDEDFDFDEENDEDFDFEEEIDEDFEDEYEDDYEDEWDDWEDEDDDEDDYRPRRRRR